MLFLRAHLTDLRAALFDHTANFQLVEDAAASADVSSGDSGGGNDAAESSALPPLHVPFWREQLTPEMLSAAALSTAGRLEMTEDAVGSAGVFLDALCSDDSGSDEEDEEESLSDEDGGADGSGAVPRPRSIC